MSEQLTRAFELSLEEIALLEEALHDYEDSLRHDAQLERELDGSEERAQSATKQAGEVSRLRAKIAAATETNTR